MGKLGPVRLSKHFFIQGMLWSEIAEFYGIMNVPNDLELLI